MNPHEFTDSPESPSQAAEPPPRDDISWDNLKDAIGEVDPIPNKEHRARYVNHLSYPIEAISLMTGLIPGCKRRKEYPTPETDEDAETSPATDKKSTAAQDEADEYVYESSCFLAWPPNLFAFTSLLFAGTGSYSRVTDSDVWPPEVDPLEQSSSFEDTKREPTESSPRLDRLPNSDFDKKKSKLTEQWIKRVRDTAREWKIKLDTMGLTDFKFLGSEEFSDWEKALAHVPDRVAKLWDALRGEMKESGKADFQDMWDKNDKRVFAIAMELHAIADETCLGWGIRTFPPVMRGDKKIIEQPGVAEKCARYLLRQFGSMATIHPDRGRVLPKRHTPELGITLRSISSNLAFHRSSVLVSWDTQGPTLFEGAPSELSQLSLLLLPWPLEIYGQDFKAVGPRGTRHFFEYRPDERALKRYLTHDLPDLLVKAEREVGKPDIVVLPELALLGSELRYLQHALIDTASAYITGIRTDPKPEGTTLVNRVCFAYRDKSQPDGWSRIFQDKHHPWCLTDWQIGSYQLGGRLNPKHNWWENINIGQRKVRLTNLGQELTICPLICEDLARQDPIAELIRAVGPSLVIAILMDGPQLRKRWAANYASVLADDPGSSVLTLTPYGMVRRYFTPDIEKSGVVGLWRDRESAREIRLEPKAKGIALSLAVRQRDVRTADGRQETRGTYTLTMGGIHQLYT